jgi:Cysteine-rich secretory protein family
MRISSKRFFATYLVLAVISIVVLGAGLYVFRPKPQTPLKRLSLLRVPKEPVVYLPGPLVSPKKNTSVLGAQPIDPRDIITYVNDERMKRGSPPLRVNETLTKAAQMRADVILKYQNFSHQDPYEHIQLDSVLPKLHYPFAYASENIGMGDDSGKAFVNGFMSSTAHKANLLNPDLVETGVAIVTGPYQQYYVNIAVQLFAIPIKKEEYLGYSDADIKEYQKLTGDIQKQIDMTRDYINRNTTDKEYYEGWERILIRQREIVVTLYGAMVKEQPFVKNFITLIQEYNTNWNLTPQKRT